MWKVKPKSLVLFFLAVFAYILSGTAYAGPDLPEKYSPVQVAEGVKGTARGTLAWSPDGKKIAYIRKNVEAYDIESGEKSLVELEDAYFVSWVPGGELLVLYRGGDGPAMGRVDTESLEVAVTVLPFEAEAAYPLAGGRRLLLTSLVMKEAPLWTEFEHGLYVYSVSGDSGREVFRTSRAYTIREPNVELFRGWVSAGPNPLGEEMLFLEIIDPPALRPYLKINLVDHVTGSKREITRMQRGMFHSFGSWAPRGEKAALSDDFGHLRILGLDGTLRSVDESIRGDHPSWNPRGSQIFFGGYLVDSGGEVKEEIVHEGRRSFASWSPDGTRLALVLEGELWLLSGFRPSFVPPEGPLEEGLKKKVRILRELFRDGFLTQGEYRERFERLRRK